MSASSTNSLIYTTAQTLHQLQAIRQLQSENLPTHLSETEKKAEGFVTLQHSLDLLQDLSYPRPHSVVLDGEKLVGYVLAMDPTLRHKLPRLEQTFIRMDKINVQGRPLKESRYALVGQICIAKKWRGQGIFKELYDHYMKRMAKELSYIATLVDLNNQRSLRAHHRYGFTTQDTFTDQLAVNWAVIVMDLSRFRT